MVAARQGHSVIHRSLEEPDRLGGLNDTGQPQCAEHAVRLIAQEKLLHHVLEGKLL